MNGTREILPPILITANQSCTQEIVVDGPAAHVVVIAAVSGTYSIRFMACNSAVASKLVVFLLLSDNHCVDLTIVQEYSVDHSSSSVHVYGVVAGNVRLHCRCQTIASSAVSRVHALQKSSFILLSTSASVSVMPAMQTISQEHVIHHGAAVGSFDSDQLFLLAAWGISCPAAKRLLLKSFFMQGAMIVGYPDLPACVDAEIDLLTRG